jgi:hypothetical protein
MIVQARLGYQARFASSVFFIGGACSFRSLIINEPTTLGQIVKP